MQTPRKGRERPSIRLQPAEREEIDRALELEGLDFSSYARRVLLRSARAKIRQAERARSAA